MKSTVVDESLSSYQPMYCSREYQASTRLIQQYEKSTPNYTCQNPTICNAKLYMHYPSSLQTHKESKWEKGQYISVLFVIPVIIDIHRHRFKIFTLVSEIHDNVDLVMGMKNIFELEAMIDS